MEEISVESQKVDGRKMIVAVDDSPMVLKTLESMLRDKYNIVLFSKGMRALGYFKQNRPDMIILDVDMPDINGYQLLRQINNLYSAKSKVPVIFLTSNSEKSYVEKAVMFGAVDYAVKPIKEDVLLQKIHRVLKDA